jgi:hypothetical protein
MRGECKACGRHRVLGIGGYCVPCADDLREMVDSHDTKPLDGDSYDDVKEDDHYGTCG